MKAPTLAAALLLLGPQAAAADEACRLDLLAALPVVVAEGEVLAAATVNGRTTTMAIDTGSPVSTIDSGLVAALGLWPRQTRLRLGGVDGSAFASAVRITELGIGGLTRRGDRFIVQPSGAGDGGRPWSGVLGADLLADYEVELNLAGSRVNLFSRDHCRGAVVYWSPTFYELPMTVSPDHHIAVDVRIDGKTVRGWLDTGAGLTAMEKRIAVSRLGLAEATLATDPASSVSGMLGERVGAHLHRFATIEIDGIMLRNWAVEILDDPVGEAPPGNQAGMVIGLDLISRLRLFISYKEQAIYFTGPVPQR